jgi:hypothetical protein
MTFDIGTNTLTAILVFLGLKFLLPLVIGFVLLAGAFLFFRLVAPQITFNRNWLIVVVCAVLILILVMATN